jgi:hypothetical protein
MVYLDDIIIYSQSHEEHLKHLRLVLERLQIHGLCCAPQKCHLGAKKINYLGHVVTDQGNYPQEHHLQQIQSATPPKDRRSLRSFLGLCNWLRDYVPNFADLAYPLTDLLGQKKPYRWGTLEQEAFESVKGALSAPLMLHRPDPNKTFVLQTDASGVGMAAVLYQEDGANLRVISYSSARFNKTERRYHSNEQECLAVVWAIRRYRPYQILLSSQYSFLLSCLQFMLTSLMFNRKLSIMNLEFNALLVHAAWSVRKRYSSFTINLSYLRYILPFYRSLLF